MKIIVTGSLGNISKPLTEELVRKGHSVTVVSSKPNKQKAIELLGAKAAIGTIEDFNFLTATFTGADAVYCMIPLNFTEPDFAGYLQKISNNYLQALKQAEVKRVVVLSGWAADIVKVSAGFIPCSDSTGEIEAVGEDVSIYKPGDRFLSVFHPRWYAGKPSVMATTES